MGHDVPGDICGELREGALFVMPLARNPEERQDDTHAFRAHSAPEVSTAGMLQESLYVFPGLDLHRWFLHLRECRSVGHD